MNELKFNVGDLWRIKYIDNPGSFDDVYDCVCLITEIKDEISFKEIYHYSDVTLIDCWSVTKEFIEKTSSYTFDILGRANDFPEYFL